MQSPRISIVVPLAPGETAWQQLLPHLQQLAGVAEVLLVHCTGTSTEAAPARESTCALQVKHVDSAQGRARQQNAGAAHAAGVLLWFLHADSIPDVIALATVSVLQPAQFDALGWFALRFHDGGMLHRANAGGANLRSRLFALPFGDQGLLLGAARFRALGGFDEHCGPGEDLDLVVRARHAGIALQRLPGCIATSARRYREHGWARTTLRHLLMTWSLRRAARQRLQGDRA